MNWLRSIRKPLEKIAITDGQRGRHGMFLRQPPHLSRAILWTLMITTTLLLLWAAIARIDEVVMAPGKLEPINSVIPVQSAEAGVIKTITIREGQRVKAGDVMIQLDTEAIAANVKALEERLANLRAEYDFYQKLASNPSAAVTDGLPGSLPEEVVALAKDRATLAADNNLLAAMLKHSPAGLPLTPEQLQLFEVAERDREERIKQATLAAESAEKQLSALVSQASAAEKLLKNSREISESYETLTNRGSMSRIEFLLRQAEYIRSQTNVEIIADRMAGLRLDISRAREEQRNVDTAYIKEAMNRRTENDKNISEIDARLGKISLEVRRQITDGEGSLAMARVRLQHHTISAPADGVIQELRFKKPGAVISPSEALMLLVPDESLVAKVEIPNEKIGFVKEGMDCEIRIDTFPYREFGQIHGKLAIIGSDAVPNASKTGFVFPARVSLNTQSLVVRGQTTAMQSGMSVSVNIHVRRRSVMSLFVDFLMRPVEQLEQVR